MPGDRYGSRDTLKAVGFMYVASALGCAFCWNLESFYVFRFIGGLAIGASSVLAPVYISEIAPADRRGALTGLFQFNIVFGILSRTSATFVVQELSGGADLWRLKLGIAAVPAVVFAMLMYTHPAEPALAGIARRTAEAKAGAGDASASRIRTRCSRIRSGRAADARRNSAERSSRGVPQADPARDPARHVQPALGHQRDPLLPQRHLRGRGFQRLVERAAGGGHRRGESGRHHDRAARHRSLRPQEAAADRRDRHGLRAAAWR